MSQSTNANIVEKLLLEATRRQLIQKSVGADRVKSYGTTRWERRNNVHAFGEVNSYNRIDFNSLFKADLMNMILPIHGESNDYSVEVLFEGICTKLREELKRNNYQLEYKIVYRAIINAINAGDILVACTCPDWKYRQSYQSTKGQYNAGKPELRPANITNPNDTKGAGCKHVMNILGNLDWAMRLATSINNYIFYMKDHYPDLFAQIIWPAISGMSYDQGEQQGLFGDLANTMETSEGIEDIDKANDSYYFLDDEVDDVNPDSGTYFEVEEPEDFDVPDVPKDALQSYYINDNHTREETQKRFNLTADELRDLLDKYDLHKREAQ